MISLSTWDGGKEDPKASLSSLKCVTVALSQGGQRPLEAAVCEVENDSIHLCLSLRLRKDRDFLSISNVNEGDKGTYTCSVRSEIDEDSASARLTVLGTLR